MTMAQLLETGYTGNMVSRTLLTVTPVRVNKDPTDVRVLTPDSTYVLLKARQPAKVVGNSSLQESHAMAGAENM
jgi:hypothetical protein